MSHINHKIRKYNISIVFCNCHKTVIQLFFNLLYDYTVYGLLLIIFRLGSGYEWVEKQRIFNGGFQGRI